MKKAHFRILRAFLLLVVIIDLLAIFCFSNQPSNISYAVTGQVMSVISKTPQTQEEWNLWGMIVPFVRKLAHIFLYSIFSTAFYLYICTVKRLNKKSIKGRLILTVALAMLIGVLDEYHQSFIPGRGASFWDVIIDVIGALLGVMFASLIIRIRMRRKM